MTAWGWLGLLGAAVLAVGILRAVLRYSARRDALALAVEHARQRVYSSIRQGLEVGRPRLDESQRRALAELVHSMPADWVLGVAAERIGPEQAIDDLRRRSGNPAFPPS